MPVPPLSVPLSTRLRYLAMGLRTVVGGRPGGFFIPYRHADSVGHAAPAEYPAAAAAFERAADGFREVLAAIDDHAEALLTIPDSAPPPSPRWGQLWFPGLDAAAAYALVRRHRPARIVEVGAGHSTRFLARARLDGDIAADHRCIDPRPRAALDGLPVRWVREVLAVDHLPLFTALEAGDIAFFDASHILMPGTDVDIILNRILPSLRPGVLVHFHDIFLPDPYPASWAWRGYNEQAAVAALVANRALDPVFASRYALTRMQARQRSAALAAIPVPCPDRESSLWVRVPRA
ncbi:class I SAM-dependent methyltransferase [Roseospira goensis]|uniref:Putative O-methyltransferase YrrM n=1 Tax=Roseospira goensis TaxID=391922 RepID=A0A7W6S0I5_9PROT|nr:class I SAM-dependent methyltransferase [Roseospira goensis]MBB4286623.1 putative O-methyltransferase YrrM [Roseospira goensis]